MVCQQSPKLAKPILPPCCTTQVVTVVNGAIPEATALLKLEWGLIFFTGSERVGKIVATAAAATLTPTVLELGGKSPVYIDDHLPEINSMIQANRHWVC